MPNIAAVLKAEISRLAKKEAKAATSNLQRASVQYRTDIAKLKRLIGHQAKEIAALRKQQTQPQTTEEPEDNARFSARSVTAQRKRLGLSALDYGKLIGVSALTIYSWESGKSKPRKAQFDSFVAIRGIGKRQAARKLEEIEAAEARRRDGGRGSDDPDFPVMDGRRWRRRNQGGVGHGLLAHKARRRCRMP